MAGRGGAARGEGPVHRTSSRRPALPSLGRGHDDPTDEPHRGRLQLSRQPHGQDPRLVVASFGEPVPGERHPCDRIDGRVTERRDRARQGRPDVAPSRELESMDRGLDGPGVVERSPSAGERLRRAVVARRHRPFAGPPTARAPRRLERLELAPARGAERPGASTTASTSPREHDVERLGQRGHVCATVAAGTDIATAAARPRARTRHEPRSACPVHLAAPGRRSPCPGRSRRHARG